MKNVTKLTIVSSMILIILLLVSGGCARSAVSEKPEDFFKGKTITVVARDAAGGGTDTISRILGPYLQSYTGARAVVVENVPEAGGIVAANRVFKAIPDGLTLLVNIPNSPVIAELTGTTGIEFKSDQFVVLFALTSEPGSFLVVNAKGPYKSVADLKTGKTLKSAGSWDKALQSAYFADILGFNANVSTGVATNDARMALLRGEIDYYVETPGGAVERVKSGDNVALVGELDKRHVVLPDVPSVTDVAKLSSQQKTWVELRNLSDLGKWLFSGPGVPKDRVEYLRSVLEKIHKDPKFLEERKTKFQRWPVPEPWLTGAEAEKSYQKFISAAKGQYGGMVDYLSKKYFTSK